MKAINGLVILMIFFTTVAKSEVYKWVDENGQVHYTDKPQPKIKNKEVLELKADIGPRETAKAKARLRNLQKQLEENARVNKYNKSVRKQKRADARRRQAHVRKNCGYAKRNIETLNSKSWGLIQRKNALGIPGNYVTVKQRPAEIKKNQDYLDRHC